MEFNLTEAFKEQYEIYLQEEANREFEESFEILEKGQKQYLDALNILESYMTLFEEDKENKTDIKNLENAKQTAASLINLYFNQSNDELKQNKEDNLYNPISGFQQVTRISEMKFPQNIVFFITQLITWIKNLVLAFIEKFGNSVRLLLGIDKERRKSNFSEEDLKLKLNSVKEIATEYMFNPADNRDKDKKVSLISIPADQVEKYTGTYGILNASYELTEAIGEKTEKDSASDKAIKQGPDVKVISFDTSKELIDLQHSLEHFVSLYNNAYGSNDEWMFGTDDLELMMNVFKQTYQSIKSGNVPTYDVAGTLTEVDTIDKNKLRENLIRTNTNTENLKKAYLETAKKIETISGIVGHKQLLGAQSMGIQYGFLSAASYEVMISLTRVINEYLRDAEKNEKKLHKMRDQYSKIAEELGKLRSAMQGVSSIAYTSIYQKRIDNLFMASRYMTQTVTLRLTTLGLYIKELRDIKELLINLNSVNLVNRNKNKLFKKIF